MSAPVPRGAHELGSRLFLQGALIALVVTLLVGLLSAVYSSPSGAALLEPLGIDMRDLRPLHTVFGAAWIILGALAVVLRDLQVRGNPVGPAERWRLRTAVLCFAGAGLGIAITVPLGVSSGREYLGFHPGFSAVIAVGWVALAWSYLGVTWRGIWDQPVYRVMWAAGFVLFLWTLAEQYAWLLPGVFADPIVDRRLQWKACGTLVGAFNFLVYGGLLWLGARISGDEAAAHSRSGWALWFVSAANTLLNYVHHTYHLPQSHGLKWWGFLISMTELILLVRTAGEVLALARKRHAIDGAVLGLLAAVKGWSLFMLFTSVIIAIPPLNSLVHGTYLIPGHAMGGMVGIDTMAVLAMVVFLVSDGRPAAAERLDRADTLKWIGATNLAVAGLVLWLHVLGAVDGVLRYLAPSGGGFSHRPAWLSVSLPIGLVVFGGLAVVGFAALLWRLVPLAWADEPGQATTRHTDSAA